jgi:thioredoxin reductase
VLGLRHVSSIQVPHRVVFALLIVADSFHCLYCHGWEEKGAASAGVLAEGDIASVSHALHIARQTLRISKEATIYTNGDGNLANDLRAAIDTATVPMKVDSRKIESLVKAPHRARCNLHFTDGTSATEAFIAHKPKTKLRGDLAQQLCLELAPAGIIKVNPPFNQTSLRGVFATGDCAAPMQTVTNALQSGSCTGGGAPLQIQAETCNQKALF